MIVWTPLLCIAQVADLRPGQLYTMLRDGIMYVLP